MLEAPTLVLRRLYWPVHLLLLGWVVLTFLHVLVSDFLIPLVLMVAVDWLLTRNAQAIRMFGGCLLGALIVMLVLQSVLPVEGRWYRFVSAGVIVAAIVIYQLLLSRLVRRRDEY
jgi:hypothetical protein